MRWQKRCLWAAAVWLLGCGGSGAKDASSPDSNTAQGPEHLRAQFEREAEPIQKHVVRADGAFTAYIEADSPPEVTRGENHVTVTANVWETTVHCFVYDDAIDTGSASTIMIREAAKSVKFQKLAPYMLDHHGLDPILAIRGVYHVEQNGSLAAGDFKLMVMPRLEHPVLCVHDSPGYAQSFARVTAEFAKSFKYRTTQPSPIRGELWAITLEGMPVGFSRYATYSLEDGDVRRVGFSGRFLPTAPGEIAFEDSAEIVTCDREGKIKSGKYIGIENGESSLEIDLERTAKGYSYVGTIQSKAVDGKFKPKQPLKSSYAFERKLKSLAGKTKKAKVEQWEYLPEIDVSQGSKVDYEVTAVEGGLKVVSRIGQRGMTMEANERGVLKRGLVPIGAKNVEIVLLEETGEL